VYRVTVGLHDALPDAPPAAPLRPLSTSEQALVVAWAGRSARLTPERFEELAQLGRPLTGLPAGTSGRLVAQRLLGIAHWVLGGREAQR
jgi:hypothetical protein